MHYCVAKVQRNYNYYNGYFNECLQKNKLFFRFSFAYSYL